VDTALVRLPFPGQQRLRLQPLCAEERWAALPEQHPLAARQLIPAQQLWDEPFVAGPAECGVWREHWLAADERGGRRVRIGAEARPGDDWLDAVAAGRGVALVPRTLAGTVRRGVAFRPVTGIRPSTVAVAWSAADDANPVVRDFAACCLSVRN
jgi:DNA-binding transcriptional LysR family regulator